MKTFKRELIRIHKIILIESHVISSMITLGCRNRNSVKLSHNFRKRLKAIKNKPKYKDKFRRGCSAKTNLNKLKDEIIKDTEVIIPYTIKS